MKIRDDSLFVGFFLLTSLRSFGNHVFFYYIHSTYLLEHVYMVHINNTKKKNVTTILNVLNNG